MEVDIAGDLMTLNMGPQHPSTHGVLRLELKTDGEVVHEAIPHIGYLHRCFEKHAENVDYPGVIPFTDRMDYVASMNNNLGYALAVERLMGIQVNNRVRCIRIIMAELNRIASHLLAAGTYGIDMGSYTPFLHCFRDREKILDLFEETCGARLLYNYNWVGGLMYDIPTGFEDKVVDFLDYFEPQVDNLNRLLSGYYIVSDGSLKPYRVKVKSPCFTAMSAFTEISRGAMISDIVAIVGSIDIVLGEIDR